MQFNFSKKFLISLSVFVFSILVIFFTRTVPVSQLWKGYKLVYVKSEKLSDVNILSILEKNQCKNVICGPDQNIPVYSKIAPVQVQDADSWLYRRTSFFTDSTQAYKIFYVPDSQGTQLSKALDELNCYAETMAGVDGASTFPWLSPILSLIFAFVLFYFSKNRRFFAAASVPFVIFSFCRPLYTCCGAVLLALFAVFLVEKIYGRRGFYKDLKNAFYVLPLLVLPVFFLVFSSAASSGLFILTVLSSGALVVFQDEIKSMIMQKQKASGFSFVLIKGSSSIHLFSKKTVFFALSVSFCTLLLLIFSAVFSGISQAGDFQDRPLLPSPVSSVKSEENRLPELIDFMDWSFATISLPYRKLGAEKQAFIKGDSIFIDDFYFSNKGSIESRQTKVLTYDSSFESSIYDTLNELKYPALEKMLLKQGKNSHFAYTKNTGSTSEKAVVGILLFFAVVPAFLCLYWLTGKLRNDFSL